MAILGHATSIRLMGLRPYSLPLVGKIACRQALPSMQRRAISNYFARLNTPWNFVRASALAAMHFPARRAIRVLIHLHSGCCSRTTTVRVGCREVRKVPLRPRAWAAIFSPGYASHKVRLQPEGGSPERPQPGEHHIVPHFIQTHELLFVS